MVPDLPKRVIGTTMSFILQPWQLLLLILAGSINREQQEVIEYLRTENRILRELHGKNGSSSTTTSAVAWRSRASCWAGGYSETSRLSYRRMRSCVGTGSLLLRSGTTATGGRVPDGLLSLGQR